MSDASDFDSTDDLGQDSGTGDALSSLIDSFSNAAVTGFELANANNQPISGQVQFQSSTIPNTNPSSSKLLFWVVLLAIVAFFVAKEV